MSVNGSLPKHVRPACEHGRAFPGQRRRLAQPFRLPFQIAENCVHEGVGSERHRDAIHTRSLAPPNDRRRRRIVSFALLTSGAETLLIFCISRNCSGFLSDRRQNPALDERAMSIGLATVMQEVNSKTPGRLFFVGRLFKGVERELA